MNIHPEEPGRPREIRRYGTSRKHNIGLKRLEKDILQIGRPLNPVRPVRHPRPGQNKSIRINDLH